MLRLALADTWGLLRSARRREQPVPSDDFGGGWHPPTGVRASAAIGSGTMIGYKHPSKYIPLYIFHRIPAPPRSRYGP
jgi:hypothetical protein